MAEEQIKNPILRAITKSSDIMMAVGVISILILMIIPLPTQILDILLAFNITAALVVLMVSLYITSPLELAAFPGMLLVLTLFRLSLNVSSTRLILGTGYAGEVIRSFGLFVVGGNYIVGFIVFLILVLINFLVIVKGSGRIAEVAARFTLDAMPGKQMAIDADLNAGMISEEDARMRRKEIARESEFHGAMDGASKFVKGDAIAGLIITGVNIIGGLIIGMVQQGLPFSEAVTTYTLLTVGDGLVTQIPALIISTSAGIIVTRAAADSNLGQDIQKQLLSQPIALFIASGTLMFFAVMPGLPGIPFFVLAVIAGTVGFVSRQALRDVPVEEVIEEVEVEPEEKIEDYLQVDPLELEIGYGLIPLVDAESGGDLLTRITNMRKQVALEMGIIVPPIRIRDNIQLGPNDYVIKIRGNEIARSNVNPGEYMAMNPGTVTEPIEGIETTELAFGLPAIWVKEEDREKAELAGYTVVEASAVIATHLMELIKNNAWRILGRQDVHQLVENLKKDYSTVVDEVTPAQLNVGAIQKVLQNLLMEKIPIRDMVTILETLGDRAPYTKDPDLLAEFARASLAETISKMYQDEKGVIHVITVDPKIEQLLTDGIKQAQTQGIPYTMEPELFSVMQNNLANLIEEIIGKGFVPVVLCSPNIRIYLRKLLETAFPQLVILSYNELSMTVQVETIGGVSLDNED